MGAMKARPAGGRLEVRRASGRIAKPQDEQRKLVPADVGGYAMFARRAFMAQGGVDADASGVKLTRAGHPRRRAS
ncbi:hypothetical protein SBV1_1820003 [Verrucomicrobia bacterium]|nr:hypothetical protein SBV1_1820003 [Verrucomicrobiota bacterium]